jgi:hypothetical protein
MTFPSDTYFTAKEGVDPEDLPLDTLFNVNGIQLTGTDFISLQKLIFLYFRFSFIL